MITSTPRFRNGFSLTELLVVIVLVGILLAVLLPSLGVVRQRADRLAIMAQLRSHAQVFAMYAGDSNEGWPSFLEPTREPSWVSSGSVGAELHYFETCYSWNIALSDRYYGEHPSSEVFFPAGYSNQVYDPYNVFTPFVYSCAFIADPRYWEAEHRRDDRSQWNGTRADQVRFASEKVLLLDSWNHPLRDRGVSDKRTVSVALTDASAMSVASASKISGYPRGDGVTIGGHPSDPPVGLHTMSGVHGRDVARSR